MLATTNSFLPTTSPIEYDNGFASNFGFLTKDPDYKKPIYGIPMELSNFDIASPFLLNDYGKARMKLLLNPEQSAVLDEIHNNMLIPSATKLFGDNTKLSKPHWNGEFNVTFPKTRPVDVMINGQLQKGGLQDVVKLMDEHIPVALSVKVNVWASKRDDDQVKVGYYATLQKITF